MLTSISICIPAYKRVNYLERLLKSIDSQSYLNFDVIITDDSGEDTVVEKYLNSSVFKFKIQYFKNKTSLGSPMNWLAAMSHAKGDWIKIMHDDDYFSSIDSLKFFADNMTEGIDCIFSGYNIVYDNYSLKDMTIKSSLFKRVLKNPFILSANNVIGPPSVLALKREILDTYDTRLKWIVDWEYYIRLASKYNIHYINKPLVCVSYNDSQITNAVKGNPNVEIPEMMIFLQKYNVNILKSVIVYDSWWRLIRNLNINSVEKFSNFHHGNIPNFIIRIIKFQSLFKAKFIKIGAISKILMFGSYIKFRYSIYNQEV